MNSGRDMNIKIFVSHSPNHHDKKIEDSRIYVNIEAGAALSGQKTDCGDNTGDNISYKNASYCELTTQYWAWKNINADYYGFCHYRRYFSFGTEKLTESRFYRVEYPFFEPRALQKICADDYAVNSIVPQYDFIVAKGIDTRLLNGSNTVFEHYAEAPALRIKDLKIVLQIIEEKYPEYQTAANKYLFGHIFYPCNMFIAKKDLFKEYSEFVFGVLKEFENRCDFSDYSREAYRTPGHLGERILGIYYTYLKEKNKYQLKELQQVFFQNVEEITVPLPVKNEIPIVLAANNSFVPILSTCIQSIIEKSSSQYFYGLYILHTDIPKEKQDIIKRQTIHYENIKILFINVSAVVSGYQLRAKAHISTETFFRFISLELMKNYEKIIYLDCDTIVQRDIAELYHIDIGKCMAGAASDPDFIGQCFKKNIDTGKYAKEFLKIDPMTYFQAGVLIINIAAFREKYSMDDLLALSEDTRYRYSDQDVLNIVCNENWFNIGMRWNMLTDCDHTRISNVIRYAPKSILEEYEEARINPFIIHYAGFMKPWNRLGEDFGDVFWKVARRSGCYEELLDILKIGPPKAAEEVNGIVSLYNRIFPETGIIRKSIRVYIKPLFYKSKIGMKIIKYMS